MKGPGAGRIWERKTEVMEKTVWISNSFEDAGAADVSWHGFPRCPGDIDFLVRPTPENAALVLRAIADFGMGSLGISVADPAVPGKVVQPGFEPNRIDLMSSIVGERNIFGFCERDFRGIRAG